MVAVIGDDVAGGDVLNREIFIQGFGRTTEVQSLNLIKTRKIEEDGKDD